MILPQALLKCHLSWRPEYTVEILIGFSCLYTDQKITTVVMKNLTKALSESLARDVIIKKLLETCKYSL